MSPPSGFYNMCYVATWVMIKVTVSSSCHPTLANGHCDRFLQQRGIRIIVLATLILESQICSLFHNAKDDYRKQ